MNFPGIPELQGPNAVIASDRGVGGGHVTGDVKHWYGHQYDRNQRGPARGRASGATGRKSLPFIGRVSSHMRLNKER